MYLAGLGGIVAFLVGFIFESALIVGRGDAEACARLAASAPEVWSERDWR